MSERTCGTCGRFTDCPERPKVAEAYRHKWYDDPAPEDCWTPRQEGEQDARP